MKRIFRTVRIGVIGAGGIMQSRHLPGLREIPGARLVAVCNRSEASSLSAARRWGFQRIAKTPSEILQASDIDAVMIGTWPHLHCDLSCAALKSGKHVFTQARMARNLAEGLRMEREARRHPRLVAMICPSPYGMKVALFVRKLIRTGFVGKIRLVRFHSLNASVADPATPIQWRQQARLNGVNTLSFGIYMERFLQWFGPVQWIQAAGTVFTERRHDADGKWAAVTVPDQIGVIAQLQNHPGQMNLTFSGAVHHAEGERIEIYGDRGTLRVDFLTEEVQGARAGEKALRRLNPPRSLQRRWTVEKDFIDAIRAGGSRRLPRNRRAFFPPDFEEGVRYMAVTEAMVRSLKTGRRVQAPAAS